MGYYSSQLEILGETDLNFVTDLANIVSCGERRALISPMYGDRYVLFVIFLTMFVN